jgi:hypothetical protein
MNKNYSYNNNSSSFKLETFQELTQITTKEDLGLGIMRWGEENYFPQTLKNIIEQSPSAKPAVTRTAKFYRGGKFEGEDTIVNTYGLTLGDIVDRVAMDLATFDAFSIQTNFNMLGEATDMNPMRIEALRFNQFDELNFASKIGYYRNYGKNDVVKKSTTEIVTKEAIKFINIWNPKYAMAQIEALGGGISEYNGQILYYSGAGPSNYPIPPLQSAINFVLSDVENSILIRKETSTGFIDNYLLKTTLNYDDPNLISLENNISTMQGARGMGKIMTIAGLSEDEVGAQLLEKLGSGSSSAIIDSAQKTFELDRQVINGVYLIPPILSGQDVATGFSTESLKDAYNVFNAFTKPGRDRIAKEVNKILAHGNFGIESIKLVPLSLDEENVEGQPSQDGEETTTSGNTTLTNLTGRQMQGIMRIVKKFNKGELTYEQASVLLSGGFGFSVEDIDNWLVTPEEEKEAELEVTQEGDVEVEQETKEE